jgi:hypothetical protein
MRFALLFLCVMASVALNGCASNGDRESDISVPEADEREAQLRSLVAEDVARDRGSQGEGSARLLFSKPYYYKEYWVFPSEEPVYSADFTAKESVSIPLTAEVEVEKTRFATRTHRDRGDARDDNNYLRSTGIEQASYELRHGKWRRVGSLFLAQRTEEQREGQWVQVEEQREIISIEEDDVEGFWGRLKFWD